MSISIKTAREIEKMRRAGELLEKVHDELGRAIHPGMSTWEINPDALSPDRLHGRQSCK